MLARILQALMLASMTVSVPISRPPLCPGCIGLGGSSAVSGGTCGGSMSISVTMRAGACKWMGTEEPLFVICTPVSNCLPTVTRQWSRLAANSELQFCVTEGGQTFCLIPPPNAGPSGSGEDSRPSATMQCNDQTPRIFSISSASCGLSASAEAICTSCVNLPGQ